MEHNEKKHYESPLLTVVSIHTERGFAISEPMLFYLRTNASDPDQMEEYEVGNDWWEETNTFWD